VRYFFLNYGFYYENVHGTGFTGFLSNQVAHAQWVIDMASSKMWTSDAWLSDDAFELVQHWLGLDSLPIVTVAERAARSAGHATTRYLGYFNTAHLINSGECSAVQLVADIVSLFWKSISDVLLPCLLILADPIFVLLFGARHWQLAISKKEYVLGLSVWVVVVRVPVS
jgi:energy-converting hydrogenase Eha subunit B